MKQVIFLLIIVTFLASCTAHRTVSEGDNRSHSAAQSSEQKAMNDINKASNQPATPYVPSGKKISSQK